MSFPTTPSYIGQKWLDGGRVWQWNGAAWQAANNSVFWEEIAGKPTYMSGSTIVSTSAPANPIPGLQWWNPTADRLFVWDGAAWVEPNTFPSYIWDDDAVNYINRVELADAQELEIKTKRVINEFIYGCKADGIWTAIKASCVMAGARTLAGALTPLVGIAPTNVNFMSTDYNRKTGLLGDGSSKYLNSNRNANSDPQDNCHHSFYVNTAPTITQIRGFMGHSAAPQSFLDSATDGSLGSRFRATSSKSVASPQATTLGLKGQSRSASTTYTIRSGGSNFAQSSATSSATPSISVEIFRRGGTPTDARLSFYSIGESVDLSLLDARVSTLMSNFQTSIP